MGKLTVIALFLTCSFAVAQTPDASPVTDGNAKEQTDGSEKKSSRKKKVEMCQDCGHPESECTCDHHTKEEEKKRKAKK